MRHVTPRPSRRPGARGHTFVELLVTMMVLSIMATAILPIAAVSRKREKEIELRRALRELRIAIDIYHVVCLGSGGPGAGGNAQGQPGAGGQLIIKVEDDPDRTCYPKTLDLLVDGVETNAPKHVLRFLRRIPRDPFNLSDERHDAYGWKLRSTTDNPKSLGGWNRRNVFDVRSAEQGRALDGSLYRDW